MKHRLRLYGEAALVAVTTGVTLSTLAYITTRSTALAAVALIIPLAFTAGAFIALEVFDG